jgi:hypothetical protein
MSNGQVTNSISEAPANLFDLSGGGTPDINPLQAEFASGAAMKDRNSVMGGLLIGADQFADDVSYETYEGLANVFNDHTIFKNEPLIDKDGFLNIPNPADDIFKTSVLMASTQDRTYHTQAAEDAFNRLFDPKKDPVAV